MIKYGVDKDELKKEAAEDLYPKKENSKEFTFDPAMLPVWLQEEAQEDHLPTPLPLPFLRIHKP